MTVSEEYSPEGTLSEQCGRLGEDSIAIMKGLAEGLTYLHCKKRLIHLRMCPSNVLLSGSKPKIRGVCGYLNSPDLFLPVEVASYSAPEIHYGYYGYASDIWSLGLIYLELLSGRSMGGLSYSELRSCVNRINNFNIREMIGNMLRKEPARRATLYEILRTLNCPAQPWSL